MVKHPNYQGPERRQAEEVRDAPWMIRLILGQKTLFPLVAAVTIAFPILFASFRMAQDAGWIPSVMSHTEQALVRLERRFANHDERSTKAIEMIALSFRIMCENSARDASSRSNCQQIR